MLSFIFPFGVLLLASSVTAFSVREARSAEKKGGYTCLYNGTTYNEGDELPTRGSCLHCVCREGFTEPGIDHCAIIDCPDDWKGDCIPVYQEGECCPVSWNCSVSSGVVPFVSSISDKCDCDWRFFKHYTVKNCKPVYENGSCCPIRFDCPEKIVRDETVCHFKGKTYKVGEEIDDPSLCSPCTCLQFGEKPEITCPADGCGWIPDPRLKDFRCYEVYEEGRCCPSGVKCDTDDSPNKTEPTCLFEGKVYHYGQEMESKWKPCVTCYCNENFTGIHGRTCYTSDCNLQLQNRIEELEEGCIPVYHEATCCPIEYHCKTGKEEVIPRSQPAALGAKNDDEKNKCKFDGKSYNIGDVLDIKGHSDCVSCTCRTPPDFTCIHKQCPPPPNNDYVNCEANYAPGKCCPTYECVQEKPSATCDPVDCPDSCMTVTYPNGCPICDCQGLLCALPKCSPGCTLEYNSTSGSCPTCKCPDGAPSGKLSCDPVQCGPQCHKGIGSNGCPMCICGPLCSLPKCGQGCHVETFVLEGQCPTCICAEIAELAQASMQAPQIRCAPVRCSSYCREVEGPNGCPMCDCGPLCSPPKCDPGCRLEAVPSSGPCPGCVCDSLPRVIQCSPVKCTGNCYEVRVPNGCPMCMCDDLLCSTPKCPSGCHVNYDVPRGSCPDCKCPPTIPLDRPMCGPVKCGPQCHEAISPQGCPMCVCGPLCSPPKCEPGCQVQKRVSEGQCPGCDCSGSDVRPGPDMKIQCGTVKCPKMCKEARGENGCPTCACDMLCSPPKCDHGCRLQHTSPYSPCPECVCDPVPRVIQCAPVKCTGNCYEVSVPNGCPMCMCDDLLCSPPKCPSGCHVNYDVPRGSCPDCKCPPTIPLDRPMCGPVKCDPQCHEAISPQGCPMCVCGPLCSPPKCESGCQVQKQVPDGQCPGCDCSGVRPDMKIQCGTVKCPKMCKEAIGQNGCPTCACDMLCSPPKCDHGCRLQHTSPYSPCPECVCDPVPRVPSIPCSPPKCDEPGCRINYDAYPCPECVCDDRRVLPQLACSPPKCDEPGCRIDYTTQPCPFCVCDVGQVPSIPCSPPKCDGPGCRINYNAYPCPECVCRSGQDPPRVACSPPKCDEPGCRIDYTAQPCPSCVCDVGPGVGVACSPPRCDEPQCRIDYSTKPCPSCVCDGEPKQYPLRCSPPQCDDPACRIDYTTQPCPFCVCDVRPVPDIACSPPKCTEPGCRIDYTKQPCPECVCDRKQGTHPMRCSAPVCNQPGCRIDFTGYPCPECVCDGPKVSCSTPKCDEPGCRINYQSKPCPECVCDSGYVPFIACSMPQCASGCEVDYDAKPCPACKCHSRSARQVACSQPRCPRGCRIDYSTRPCPSCNCDNNRINSQVACSPPQCGPGCQINYNTRPCPSCSCGRGGTDVQCLPPMCPPGCEIDYSTQPCPSCRCRPQGTGVQCLPPMCPPGCEIDYSTQPCPSCRCRPQGYRRPW